MKLGQSENQFSRRNARIGGRSAGRSARSPLSAKSLGFRSMGHTSRSRSGSASISGKSKKGGISINMTEFMPLKSKLAIDIILIAASLEQHAKNNPKEDIYHKVKTIKTFKMLYSAINNSFNGIDEKIFSYLFLAIFLCTSREMKFSFKEYGLIDHEADFIQFAKEVSTRVFEELAGIETKGEGEGAAADTTASAKPKTHRSARPHTHGRRMSGGSRIRPNRYNKTAKNNNKYNQTGGWLDLIIAFFLDVYARRFPTINTRFRNVTFMVMMMYFIYSTFSVYNNVRHLFWPNSLYDDGELASDYTRLMDTTSSALIVGVPQQVQSRVTDQLGPLNELMAGLPGEIGRLLVNTILDINIGAITGLIFGLNFGAGGVDASALRLQQVLNRFMTTPYYARMVQHINDVAVNMGNGISAVVARTRTPPASESTGLMGFFRGAGRFLGFDIARADDQLGDILYNTVNAERISADVLETILHNTGVAIDRISRDFTRMITIETTRFRTRIHRHTWGIRHAIGGMVLAGYWLYLYARFTMEMRRRRAARGSVGQAFKKVKSSSRDPSPDGNGGDRDGNGDGDGAASASGGVPRLSM